MTALRRWRSPERQASPPGGERVAIDRSKWRICCRGGRWIAFSPGPVTPARDFATWAEAAAWAHGVHRGITSTLRENYHRPRR